MSLTTYELTSEMYLDCHYCGDAVIAGQYKSHKRMECDYSPMGVRRAKRSSKRFENRSNRFEGLKRLVRMFQ